MVSLPLRYSTCLAIFEFTIICLRFYRVDVSKRQEVLDTAALVKQQVGNVTVLVNNAGIMPCRPLFLQSHETIEKIFNVNVLAHFWVKITLKIKSYTQTTHYYIIYMFK